MPRPSKLPAFRKHLLGRGYSLATINVYVWAAAATLDAVLDRPAGGQHEGRDTHPARAQHRHQFGAVHHRQSPVDDERVVVAGQSPVQALLGVEGGVHPISLAGEEVDEHAAEHV